MHRTFEKQTRPQNPPLKKEITLVPDMHNNRDKGTCTLKSIYTSFTNNLCSWQRKSHLAILGRKGLTIQRLYSVYVAGGTLPVAPHCSR